MGIAHPTLEVYNLLSIPMVRHTPSNSAHLAFLQHGSEDHYTTGEEPYTMKQAHVKLESLFWIHLHCVSHVFCHKKDNWCCRAENKTDLP